MGFKDIIQKAAKKQAAPKQTAKTDSTEGILKQLSVGATGKAKTAAPSGQSNIAETMGAIQGQQQQQQVQSQFQEQAAQMTMAEQAAQLQRDADKRNRELQETQMRTQLADSTDALLSQIEGSDADIADREDALALETLGAQLALQDQQYVDKINDIGRRNRLQDQIVSRQEDTRLAFGNNTDRVLREIAHKKKLGEDSRQWNEANMISDIEDAERFMQAKIADEKEAAKISAIADIAKLGYKSYNYDATDGTDGTDSLGTGASPSSQGKIYRDDTLDY